MKKPYRITLIFACVLGIEFSSPTTRAAETVPVHGHTLTISGTRFRLDGKPFPYTGISFFNAIYNPSFNASAEARLVWLKTFQAYGINLLRVWCQWDNARHFVDTKSTSTLYEPDGRLRAVPLETLKSILADADTLGMCLEIVLFSQESFEDKIRLAPPADERAVATLTRELLPYRNATFQIWNEHTDARVLPLLNVIKSVDHRRLVTNAPGYSGVLGSDEENAALDYLSPHTTRKGRYWEIAAQELAALCEKFRKPVVDDEPARNGTSQFGGPEGSTTPFDHIAHILNVWRSGGYSTYHHDMFQTGYGTPAIPPSGIPDPEFNPYHRTVFDFLKHRERFIQTEPSAL